jgi:hypothetical protein
MAADRAGYIRRNFKIGGVRSKIAAQKQRFIPRKAADRGALEGRETPPNRRAADFRAQRRLAVANRLIQQFRRDG